MSIVTFLLFIASFALAGLLYQELAMRRQLAEEVLRLKEENNQLQAEQLHLIDAWDRANGLTEDYTDKLNDIVGELHQRHDDTIELFTRMRDMLSRFPDYRGGDRERNSHFNRQRRRLLQFIDEDVLGEADIDADPLVKGIHSFRETMAQKIDACQEAMRAGLSAPDAK
ncbi:hypothetical protein ZL54_22430 [Salmonella enterica subsp. enterica]|nr:hypothetical protein [Salmonella enterica subsp. enterica]EEJ7209095.1 hypothetical protein [Salmonella enterica subsp. enterica]